MVADNEDNALLCLRVSLDLHRNFRPLAEPKVLNYLEWIKTVGLPSQDEQKLVSNIYKCWNDMLCNDFSGQLRAYC